MPMNAAAPHLRTGRGTAAAVDVIANSPESLQVELNRAVAQIRATGALGGRGIRVTRRSASLFTVEAAADVPYGMTVENDSWQRPTSARPRTAGDEGAL
jgi:hypothetical protein